MGLTADGVLYLIHDDTLTRTSNVAEVFPDPVPWLAAGVTGLFTDVPQRLKPVLVETR